MVHASFQHIIRSRELNHQDRQNFEAVLRITDEKVLSLLNEFPDAKGTKYYLKVTNRKFHEQNLSTLAEN